MAIINVKDPPYNAKGDGVTDDITAVQSAVNAVVAASCGGELYFPTGVYVLNNCVTLNAAASKPITVRGEHIHGTRLSFTAATKGLKFVGSGITYDGVTIRDLTLSTFNQGGTAIEISGTAEANAVQWKPTLIENVRIRADAIPETTAGYFAKGVMLTNSGQSILRNLHYEGSSFSIGTLNNYYAGVGIEIDAAHANAAGTSIVDPDIANCQIGINIRRNVDHVTIRGGAIAAARNGVVANRELADGTYESSLVLSDFHIAAVEKCLYVEDQYGLNVHNCFFAKVGDAALTAVPAMKELNWSGIVCANWAEANIANNLFSVPTDEISIPGGATRGVQQAIVMFAGERAVISGNIFDGGGAGVQPMDIGIWMITGANNSKITYNIFRNVTTKLLDGGTNNLDVGNT